MNHEYDDGRAENAKRIAGCGKEDRADAVEEALQREGLVLSFEAVLKAAKDRHRSDTVEQAGRQHGRGKPASAAGDVALHPFDEAGEAVVEPAERADDAAEGNRAGDDHEVLTLQEHLNAEADRDEAEAAHHDVTEPVGEELADPPAQQRAGGDEDGVDDRPAHDQDSAELDRHRCDFTWDWR